MMDFLDKRAMTYEITTNGTLIGRQVRQRLKNCIGLKNILFSLDGLRAYHDKERGRGVFEECLRSLKYVQAFLPAGVCSVLKADNQKEILKLSAKLADLGVREHRIIYGMSIPREARERSRKKWRRLDLQGPAFNGQAQSCAAIMDFFNGLERLAFRNNMKIVYVPELFRTQTGAFLDGQLVKKGLVRCVQLEQLRFDAAGNRIMCEFVRNRWDKKTAAKLKNGLLPACERCCKLQLVGFKGMMR